MRALKIGHWVALVCLAALVASCGSTHESAWGTTSGSSQLDEAAQAQVAELMAAADAAWANRGDASAGQGGGGCVGQSLRDRSQEREGAQRAHACDLLLRRLSPAVRRRQPRRLQERSPRGHEGCGARAVGDVACLCREDGERRAHRGSDHRSQRVCGAGTLLAFVKPRPLGHSRQLRDPALP